MNTLLEEGKNVTIVVKTDVKESESKKQEEQQVDKQTAINLATYAFLVNHLEENFA